MSRESGGTGCVCPKMAGQWTKMNLELLLPRKRHLSHLWINSQLRHGIFAVVLVVFRPSKVLRRRIAEQSWFFVCKHGSQIGWRKSVREESCGQELRREGWASCTGLDSFKMSFFFSDSWTRTMTGFTFLMTYYTYLDCMNFRLSVLEFPLLGFDGFNSRLPQKLTWTPKKSPQRKERRLPKHHFGYPCSFSGVSFFPTFFQTFWPWKMA